MTAALRTIHRERRVLGPGILRFTAWLAMLVVLALL